MLVYKTAFLFKLLLWAVDKGKLHKLTVYFELLLL